MNCKLCKESNDRMYSSCPDCFYTVCGKCLGSECAPSRCVMCPGYNRRKNRSFYELDVDAIKVALDTYKQNDPVPTKAAAFSRILDHVERSKHTMRTLPQLRCTVAYKMKAVTQVGPTNWMREFPALIERAAKMYEFLRWGYIPADTGKEYKIVDNPKVVVAQ